MKLAILLLGVFILVGCQAVAETVDETLPPKPPSPGQQSAPPEAIDESVPPELPNTEQQSAPPDSPPIDFETSPADFITKAELAQHSTANDCWVSYKGEVYDVTNFLAKHPGGAGAIIPHCGTAEQFERAFAGQHGTSQFKTLRREGVFKGELE